MCAYFSNASSVEDAIKIYRNLCKKLHPDVGGDSLSFIQMLKEYREFCKIYGKKKKQKNTEFDQKKRESSYQDVNSRIREELRMAESSAEGWKIYYMQTKHYLHIKEEELSQLRYEFEQLNKKINTSKEQPPSRSNLYYSLVQKIKKKCSKGLLKWICSQEKKINDNLSR